MEHSSEDAAADRLIAKLRDFASGLDDRERMLLATLLAPGVAAVAADDEVSGFALEPGGSVALPRALAGGLGRAQIRVVGLDP